MVKFKNIFGLASTAVVFAGMAYGQAACDNTAAISNVVVRGESTNDFVGDITIRCINSGVTGAVPGGTVNIQLFVTSGVTFTSKTVDSGNGYSEAIAMSTPTANDNNTYRAVVGTGGNTSGYNAAAAVLGTVSATGNTINFIGLPVPALGAGLAQNYLIQISNVRVNASAVTVTTGAPPTISLTPVISGAPVFQASLTSRQVGIIEYGIGSVASYKDLGLINGGTNNYVVCAKTEPSANAGVNNVALMQVIRITENFASAFRNVGTEQSPFQLTGGNTPTANAPVATVAAGANLANNATRIKVVFTNVPSGVSLYTVQGRITSNSGGANLQFNTVEAGDSTGTPADAAFKLTSNNLTGYAPITSSSGTATAIFTIVSGTADATALDDFRIPIYITFASGIPIASTPIAATVSLAPTGIANNIPSFNAAAASTVKLTGATITACSTSLLFPFVTNILGFDTGFAIANTSKDPFGAKGAAVQSGTCTLNLYGSGAPTPASITTPNVPEGTVYTQVLSGIAAGFQGYIIAQCNFQYAHGFAFVTNGVGANGGLSQGYLAGVIPDTNRVDRTTALSESLGN